MEESDSVGKGGGGEAVTASGSGNADVVLNRSAIIAQLVTQLKHGSITKAELFTRLQKLQGPAKPDVLTSPSAKDVRDSPLGTLEGRDKTLPSPLTFSSGTGADTGAGFFSTGDRQAIIQSIADQRRHQALEATDNWPPHPSPGYTSQSQGNGRPPERVMGRRSGLEDVAGAREELEGPQLPSKPSHHSLQSQGESPTPQSL
ncbi:unnamed protein product, partial [Discosporangium mesarthrocarpum]